MVSAPRRNRPETARAETAETERNRNETAPKPNDWAKRNQRNRVSKDTVRGFGSAPVSVSYGKTPMTMSTNAQCHTPWPRQASAGCRKAHR